MHVKTKRHLKKQVYIAIAVLALAIAGVYGWHLYLKNAPKEEAAVQPTASPTATPVPTPEVYTADLFMTGDGLIHGAVYYDAKQDDGSYDFSGMLENLRPIVDKYDLKYYNQETILGGTELGLSSYPQFNTPQEFGDAMVDLGFNLVSTANNHSLDKGEQGIENSLTYWKNQKNVVTAGTYLSQEEADALPVHEINGITYTYLSYTYGCNGLTAPEGKEYMVNVYAGHEEEMLEKVRQADQISDVVMIAMHWGTEYSTEANEEQRSLAQQLSDAGADIIIGCHPHVIEPVEWIDDTICFYSLGNMISAQDQQPRLIGMIAGVTITKTVEPDGSSSTVIEQPRADLIYTYYAPGFTQFKVYPFSQLDDTLLPGYQSIYEEYTGIITAYDSSIQVGGV